MAPLARLGVCLSPQPVEGGGGEVSTPWSKIWLPRGCSRRSGAPGVAEVEGSPGRKRHGSWIRIPPPPSPLPPPAFDMAQTPAGYPIDDVPYQGRGKEAPISRPRGQDMCWAGGGSGLLIPSHDSAGRGGSSVCRAEERTLLTPARREHPSPLSGSQVSLSCLSTKPKLCWVACRLAVGWPGPHGDTLTQEAPLEGENGSRVRGSDLWLPSQPPLVSVYWGEKCPPAGSPGSDSADAIPY